MQNKPISQSLLSGLKSLFGDAAQSFEKEARAKFILAHPEALENAAKKQREPASWKRG